MFKETSLLAYYENKASGRNLSQRLKVFETIKQFQPCTRNQISQELGLRISSVCARVNELLKLGHIEVAFKDTDPVTGRKAEFLRIKDSEIVA